MGESLKLPAVTEADIARAAWAWRNDKDRETDGSDDRYFRNNWQSLPGLRAYVEREANARELRDVLGDALAGRAAITPTPKTGG